MKTILYKSRIGIFAIAATIALTSCNDFLDVEPQSQITSDQYFTDEQQLASYTVNLYTWLPSHASGSTYGRYGIDNDTDNQVKTTVNDRFVDGQWKVDADGDNWSFERIYDANYFLEQVLPKYEAGVISGSEDMIDHYVGEGYFFRAFAYFEKLVEFGDYPIVESTLELDMDVLTEASARRPRNEVARFILEDLDRAIELLSETSPDGSGNMLSKRVARLYKSRVALFEASWLTYFKGTAFVPGGSGWPGADMSYNSDFAYVSGSIDNEINFFLDEAIESADAIASIVGLTQNTMNRPDPDNEVNPYFTMFGDVDLSSYEEVLLWREYSSALGVVNDVPSQASRGNNGTGLTRGLVMSFLDVNGLPYYDSRTVFTDQDNLTMINQATRDNRAHLFFKVPGQENYWINVTTGTYGISQQGDYPPIVDGDAQKRYVTGFCSSKGMNPDGTHYIQNMSSTASPVFRAAEAYLNYMEAYYMRYGSRGGNVDKYWNALRTRAGIVGSIDDTVAALDMEKEALFDWGAYSGGQLIDETLYAIRKERRSEYVCEGIRYEDLCRWRAMDQMITTPYEVEGMRLWGDSYTTNMDLFPELYQAGFVYGETNSSAVLSDPKYGDYLKIHKVNSTSFAFNGYVWHMAHYLYPIEIQHMRIASPDNNSVEESVIYQNPYWPSEANMSAIQ